MARRATFTSLLRQVSQIQIQIARGALQASAVVVQNQARMNAQGGFKTGRFVTQGWTSITYEIVGDGPAMTARVGTTLKHFMYWELGHHNAFTRRYERKEWLLPAVMNGRVLQQQAALRAAQQIADRHGVKNPLSFSPRTGGGRRPLPGA